MQAPLLRPVNIPAIVVNKKCSFRDGSLLQNHIVKYGRVPLALVHMVAVKNAALYSGYVQNAKAEAIKKYKVQFHTLSDAEQAKALKVAIPLWDADAAKSPECKEAVDIIKKTNKYLGKMK